MSKKIDCIKKELGLLGVFPKDISYTKPKYIPEVFSDGHEGGWMLTFESGDVAQSVIFGDDNEPLVCEWGISEQDPAILQFYDFKVVEEFIKALKERKQ